MENKERAKKYIEECEELAFDAVSRACHPLLMSGDGSFFAKNGNYLQPAEVLKEHQIMQDALSKIKAKLDVAKGLI